jgi:anthranilate synthase component 1
LNVFPSLQQFSGAAGEYNTIPVMAEMSADLETPISLYLKLVGDDRGFMLESAESGKNFGRYSFIGLQPFAEFTGRSEESELVLENGIRKISKGKPLDILREFLAGFSISPSPGQPPFMGGGVGYFAYDLIATMERVRGYRLPADQELVQLLFCRVIVVFDHLNHTLKIVYLASVTESAGAEQSYAQAVTEIKSIMEKILDTQAIAPDDTPYHVNNGRFSLPAADSEIAKHYMSIVGKAKEYIAAGEAFQIVLSQNFPMPLAKHPFNLYRRLRQVNPSPYMFFLNFGANKLVGASPEMLVKVEAGKVYTCPIAGTRPRGRTTAEDSQLAAELLADEKERAEHAMLVDLGRNDIGRISSPGTVTVDRYMEVEMFSHVMHLVSAVSGQLAPKYSALDVLQACFPAGTVSGAPKVRAMEIIHQLEGDCRGPYAGAVGYLDFRGNMDTCITIRTMSIKDKQASIRVGAGIVYDSVEETEYQEVLHKGRALFKLMED